VIGSSHSESTLFGHLQKCPSKSEGHFRKKNVISGFCAGFQRFFLPVPQICGTVPRQKGFEKIKAFAAAIEMPREILTENKGEILIELSSTPFLIWPFSELLGRDYYNHF
jgi:hypothetical protein